MYLCVKCINIASFNDFSIRLLNCSAVSHLLFFILSFQNKNVDIKFSAHIAFLQWPSSGTFNIVTMENEIILNRLGTINQRAYTGYPKSTKVICVWRRRTNVIYVWRRRTKVICVWGRRTKVICVWSRRTLVLIIIAWFRNCIIILSSYIWTHV